MHINEDIILNRVTEAALGDCLGICYIDTRTDEYRWYTYDSKFDQLGIAKEGDSFFDTIEGYIENNICKEDVEKFIGLMQKDKVIDRIKLGSKSTVPFRVVIGKDSEWHVARLLKIVPEEYIIFGVVNINRQVKLRGFQEEFKERLGKAQTLNELYSQIAVGLANHYDSIYYVNIETEKYLVISASDLLSALSEDVEESRFFTQVKIDIQKVIYPEDRELLNCFFNKMLLLESFKHSKVKQIEYRLLIDGKVTHVRLTAMMAQDNKHLVMCVESIEDQVNTVQKLTEKAIHDELTGARNKNAYQEFEEELQAKIDANEEIKFAITVCDVNNLKIINDTLGHKAGDSYIQAACKLICDIFKHSPVYRVGGDEFIVYLQGEDYRNRDRLLASFRDIVIDNARTNAGPVIASGMAEYPIGECKRVSDIFEMADRIMYENKKNLKELKNS